MVVRAERKRDRDRERETERERKRERERGKMLTVDRPEFESWLCCFIVV